VNAALLNTDDGASVRVGAGVPVAVGVGVAVAVLVGVRVGVWVRVAIGVYETSPSSSFWVLAMRQGINHIRRGQETAAEQGQRRVSTRSALFISATATDTTR
jgi:hypothetical protein